MQDAQSITEMMVRGGLGRSAIIVGTTLLHADCYLSITALTRVTGLSKISVKKGIKDLRAAGFLDEKHGSREIKYVSSKA